MELTNLVGALGFQQAVSALTGHRLLCIDEFELDDPGDTVLVSTLLGRLVDAGVQLAATSNTLPGRLGEGRFAAADFLREIQGLSARFLPLRIDGEDYRHRGLPLAPGPVHRASRSSETAHAHPRRLPRRLRRPAAPPGRACTPAATARCCDGVEAVFLRGVEPVTDQATALRLVVLADRLYDREVPVMASGAPFDQALQRGDAGRRLPQEVLPGHLPAHRAGPRGEAAVTGFRGTGAGHSAGGAGQSRL